MVKKADRYILHCNIGCILFTSTLFPSFRSFIIKLPPAESSARLSDLIQFTTFTPSTLFLASVLLDDLTAVAAIDQVVSTYTQIRRHHTIVRCLSFYSAGFKLAVCQILLSNFLVFKENVYSKICHSKRIIISNGYSNF